MKKKKKNRRGNVGARITVRCEIVEEKKSQKGRIKF